ncbi:MAG: hypothetical protein M3Y07_14320 [Acidobacteriota bacterium]|nr:hypothetical protein [Acidobacteriota bacterium]
MVNPILELARKAIREKDWPEAMRQTREALELDPGNTAARELLQQLEAAAPGDATRTMMQPLLSTPPDEAAVRDPDPFAKAGKWRIPMLLAEDASGPDVPTRQNQVSSEAEFTGIFGLKPADPPPRLPVERNSEPGEFTIMFQTSGTADSAERQPEARPEEVAPETELGEFTGMFPAPPSVPSAVPHPVNAVPAEIEPPSTAFRFPSDAPGATDFPEVFPSTRPIQPPRPGPGDYDKNFFGAPDTPNLNPPGGTATQFVDTGGIFPQDTPSPAIFGDGSYTQLIEKPSLPARQPSSEAAPLPNRNARGKPVAGLFLVLAVLLLLAVALSLYFVTGR